MTDFSIEPRLLNDSHIIIRTDGISYLLHKNAEVAWFILVPHIQQTEFYLLEPLLQKQLCTQISLLSGFIQSTFSSDKINIATIGNVVSQMHVHVIGRRKDDAYWPDVVWGREFEKNYETKQVSSISDQLINYLQLNKS